MTDQEFEFKLILVIISSVITYKLPSNLIIELLRIGENKNTYISLNLGATFFILLFWTRINYSLIFYFNTYIFSFILSFYYKNTASCFSLVSLYFLIIYFSNNFDNKPLKNQDILDDPNL